MSSKTTLIDTHHHFWDLALKKHAWLLEPMAGTHLGDTALLCHCYLPEDFLKDSADFNVTKSVHIQAGWNRQDTLGEAQWLAKLHAQQGFPHAVVAYADLSHRDVEQTLAQLTTLPLVKGIRQIVSWHEDEFYSGCDKDYITLERWKKQFALLRKYHLSFDLQLYPEQVDTLLPVLIYNDETLVVVNHALMPRQWDRDYLLNWRKQLKKLSDLPNTHIKLSGLMMFDHQWTTQSVQEIVAPVVDLFGPTRCMLGSNFPVDKLYGSYQAIVSAYLQAIASYSVQEQAAICYQTAVGFYRLND